MEPRLFQLIDLDRTIFDTSGFVKALTDEINLTEPGLGTELDEHFEAAYKKEETFFLLRHLRETRGDEWFEALVDKVVAKIGAASLLLPGVKERLAIADAVTSYRPSWGILTYGDAIDQRMKVQLIGLQDAPMVLTATADKAEVLRSWQNADGTFTLPEAFGGGVVNKLTLEDDKLRAFKDLPEGVTGYWVTKDPSVAALLAATQEEGAPAGLIPVQDLSGVARYVKQNL